MPHKAGPAPGRTGNGVFYLTKRNEKTRTCPCSRDWVARAAREPAAVFSSRRTRNEFRPAVRRHVTTGCEAQGLDLDTADPRGKAPAQMEINFRHGLKPAAPGRLDSGIVKRTMREACTQHDMTATFNGQAPITNERG